MNLRIFGLFQVIRYDGVTVYLIKRPEKTGLIKRLGLLTAVYCI